MVGRLTTRERILDTSLRLFNDKGYAATTLAEIASHIGISQGNLTYHFPTKRQLVAELQKRATEEVQEQHQHHQVGALADDYVALLLFAMNQASKYRFLLRDRAQFVNNAATPAPAADMAADLEDLRGLLVRAHKDGLFRRDLKTDLEVLARSLWIVSRYWMDHLSEVEGIQEATRTDLQRGVQHHFAVLLPHLNASARHDFEASLQRALIG
jgi:AcrR family transcriptional regulator